MFVFIAPPSMEELEARLRRRATDSEEQIQTRLAAAREEMDRWVVGGVHGDRCAGSESLGS